MKNMVAVVSLAVLLAGSLVFAQVKHPFPQQVTRDSAGAVMIAPSPNAEKPPVMEKMRPWEDKERNGDGCAMCGEERRTMPSRMGGVMYHSYPRFRPLHVLCFFLFMVMIALVNIVLTILVSLDMARLGRFNGLWIPVLLVAGLPGTALYALFRIGDGIRELEFKMK